MWEQRTDLPVDESAEYTDIYGRPLVEAIGRAGGAGARIALTAIAGVDDGELGIRAGQLADGLPKLPSEPSWLRCLGETTVTAAAVMREDIFDDGFTMFLEARHATEDTHAIGVYIDNNLGVMAKNILIADSIDQVAEVLRSNPTPGDGELRLEPIEPAMAAAEIHCAMALTDITLDPPVSDDYAALRALALLRADDVPGVASPPEPRELTVSDRDQLRDEFLSAPEGSGFAADGDEARVVSLAIDFCADYVDSRPLRWSPVVVELFMASWLPRKVLADADLMAAVPSALDAWVRFAGRKRDLPQWAIDTTCEAIPRWREEMESAASDPATGSPGKQFLMAAEQAGIDLADQEALTTFMAGWNARSNAV